MRTRLLTTVLLLSLAACSKDKDKQSEGKPAPGTTPAAQQTAPANTGTQPTPAPTGAPHGASAAARTHPPAENPGPLQKKALEGQELYATLVTSEGNIVVRLFSKDAPVTVANFVGLATGEQPWRQPKTNERMNNTPLYQNILFHRVIPGFMIQ